MGKGVGFPQNFYIEGYDLSGDANSLGRVACPKEPLPSTGINKSSVERLPGRGSGEISFATFFNDASLQEHDALKGLPTADIVAYYATGLAIGDPMASLVAKQVNYDWERFQSGMLLGNIQCLGQGRVLEWGVMLTAGKVVVATDTSYASNDFGSQTTSGAAGFFNVFSNNADGTIVIIQDSPDDSTFTTLMAITYADGARISERKTVAGTVDRYVRVNVSGDVGGFVARVAVGFRRGESVDVEGY